MRHIKLKLLGKAILIARKLDQRCQSDATGCMVCFLESFFEWVLMMRLKKAIISSCVSTDELDDFSPMNDDFAIA